MINFYKFFCDGIKEMEFKWSFALFFKYYNARCFEYFVFSWIMYAFCNFLYIEITYKFINIRKLGTL